MMAELEVNEINIHLFIHALNCLLYHKILYSFIYLLIHVIMYVLVILQLSF